MSSTDRVEKLQEIRTKEKIFMIEVVIQKVFLDVIELTDFTFNNTETCLSYRFLNFGPFRICEKDFSSTIEQGGCAGCGQLKNGNSTMFPLFPATIDEIKEKGFQLEVEVLKMFKPIPRTVGTTEVNMKFIFDAVMETMVKKAADTASKSMKNRYKLKDAEGDPVGYVDLFVRFSSMGKVIITKFQMDMSRECVEFQSNAGNMYKYQKKPVVDEYVCKPCGKPKKAFPPYERESKLPAGFPAFRVTSELKRRLKERHYKEMGIDPPPSESSVGKQPKKGKGNKGKQPPPKPSTSTAKQEELVEVEEAPAEE